MPCEQLGLDRDDVSVEILERAKSGFLGLGSCPAKVRVSYGPEEAEEVPPPRLPPRRKPQEEPAEAAPEQRKAAPTEAASRRRRPRRPPPRSRRKTRHRHAPVAGSGRGSG